MAEQAKDYKAGGQTLAGPLLGAIFTIVWVTIAAGAFGLLVGYFEDPQPAEFRSSIDSLAWPFVAVSLGVPFLVFVWFGGYAALARLGELRSHLSKLGQYASDFEKLADTAKEVNENLSAASISVSEAANAINSNFDDYEKNISPQIEAYFDSVRHDVTREDAVEAEDGAMFAFVANVEQLFIDLYNDADPIFYSYVRRRNENPGRGKRQLVVTRGGWNKADIVQQLVDEQWLNENQGRVLQDVFQAEFSSRRHGRHLLNLDNVQEMRRRFDQEFEDEINS